MGSGQLTLLCRYSSFCTKSRLVLADRRRIVQVLVNLLTNAARHSRPASVIRVSAGLDGVHVVVVVADEGRGIAAERLPCLFRKFSGAGRRSRAGTPARAWAPAPPLPSPRSGRPTAARRPGPAGTGPPVAT